MNQILKHAVIAGLFCSATIAAAKDLPQQPSVGWQTHPTDAKTSRLDEMAAGRSVASDDPAAQVEQKFRIPEKSNQNKFSRNDVKQLQSAPSKAERLSLRDSKLELNTNLPIPKAKAPRRGASQVKTGVLIANDTAKDGKVYHSMLELTATDTEGEYTLYNIFGLESTVNVSIDVESGTVTIPCQKVATISGYGDLKICPVAYLGNGWGYGTEAVSGVIDANGVISMNPWGLVITEGAYAGETMVIMPMSTWTPSNVIFSSVSYNNQEADYEGLVQQDADGNVHIHNLSSLFAEELIAEPQTDGSLKLYPQLVTTQSGNDYYIFPADVENEVVYTRNPVIISPSDDGSYNVAGWCVALRTSPWSGMGMLIKGTNFTPATPFIFPTATTLNLEGKGTQSEPYLLKTAADFQALAESVAAGNDYSGKSFSLVNDIDMDGITLTPIGTEEAPFCGSFNGGNHTISNLQMITNRTFTGLFGYLGLGSSVSNLNMQDIIISGSGYFMGSVAAYSEGNISNVKVEGKLCSDGYMVGGITSASEGMISNCSFSGAIEGSGTIGGIVGYNYGIITGCDVKADLSTDDWLSETFCDMGGIVGTSVNITNHRYQPLIQNCSVTGSMVDYLGGANMGGIGGRIHYSTVKKCFNTAVINAHRGSAYIQNYTGGLAGWTLDSSISDCYNAATITKTGYQSNFVGGLVGYLGWEYYLNGSTSEYRKLSHLTNCINTGQVISTSAAPYKGLYGVVYGASNMDPVTEMIHNSYFDNQISVFADPRFGRNTSFFTGANLPEGFGSEWIAKEGEYPRLSGLQNKPGADLGALAVTFANDQTIRKVMSDFKIATKDGVIWTLFANNQVTQETPSLKIVGNTVKIKDEYAIDMLAAVGDEGYSVKYYRVGVVPKVFEGEGTADSPYLLKTPDDFATLHKAVSVCDHAGDYFAMANDIDFDLTDDFSGVGFGNYYDLFCGSLDGRNHFIKGLKVDGNKARVENGGLICQLGNGGEVSNVNIADDCQFIQYSYSGTVVGDCNGLVKNCRNYADVSSSSDYVGGIVGGLDENGVIENCYNQGTVTTATMGAGGIAAITKGQITNCLNAGNINAATKYAGGIVGNHGGAISNCLNLGNICANEGKVAGIAGGAQIVYAGGAISNSVNVGIIKHGNDYETIGGIAGELSTLAPISNNYYDNSTFVSGGANGIALAEINGKSTAELVNGEPLDSLDANIWNFAAGSYPMLKAFESEPYAKILASTYAHFPAGTSRANVTAAIPVISPDGVEWSVNYGSNFNVADGQLNVTIPESSLATDMLVAKMGDRQIKAFEVKAIPNLFEGQGSAENPFLLKTVDDMNRLANFVASSRMDYDGYTFALANDIDYENAAITPIKGVGFQGVFDGKGYTISNFTNNSTSLQFIGALFEKVGERGAVRNLTMDGMFLGGKGVAGIVGDLYGQVSNCVNKSTVYVASNTNAAGIAGWVYAGAHVTDCRNEGKIYSKNSSNIAGIAVYLYANASIERCTNSGEIIVGNTTKANSGAGIVWDVKANALVEDCVNTGTITGKSYLSGIAGNVDGTVRNCRNEGSFAATSGFISGVVNKIMANGIIENCHNTADIDISEVATVLGGIVSSASGSHKGYIKDCTNTGNLKAKGSIGGIAATVESGLRVENCFNYGDLYANGTTTSYKNVGGIAGTTNGSAYAGYSSIVNCGNTGKIDATVQYVGGIAGSDLGCNIEGCWNTAEISVTKPSETITPYQAAGIVGYHQREANIRDSWNSGNIYTEGTCGGGIAGACLNSGNIDGCLNTGDVKVVTFSSNGSAAGIVPYTTGSSSVTNSINAGKVEGPARIAGLIGSIQMGKPVHNNLINVGVVRPDSVSVKNPSHNTIWAHNDGYTYLVNVDKIYYDTTIAEFKGCYDDSIAVCPLPTKHLANFEVSDKFVNYPNCYPILASMTDNGYAQWAAVTIVPEEKERHDSIDTFFHIGQLPKVTWTMHEGLSVDDEGCVRMEEPGEAWLTAEYIDDDGEVKASKTYQVKVLTASSGMTSVEDDLRQIVGRTYYDINGRIIARPVAGQPCIIVTEFNDGTRSTSKQVAINR